MGSTNTLRDISLEIPAGKVTAFIGPSGCGKSTLLRCLNRMNDLVDTAKVTGGSISILGQDINAPDVEAIELRKHVGMVFQKYNPFPKSIYENVAYGPRIHGVSSRSELDGIVEDTLRRAALWDEVQERLHTSALSLSGGQQQRLCIARALAVKPDVLLMDEPASALDPLATAKIEELEGSIESFDSQLLDPELSSDWEKLFAIQEERRKAADELESLFARWEELPRTDHADHQPPNRCRKSC